MAIIILQSNTVCNLPFSPWIIKMFGGYVNSWLHHIMKPSSQSLIKLFPLESYQMWPLCSQLSSTLPYIVNQNPYALLPMSEEQYGLFWLLYILPRYRYINLTMDTSSILCPESKGMLHPYIVLTITVRFHSRRNRKQSMTDLNGFYIGRMLPTHQRSSIYHNA